MKQLKKVWNIGWRVGVCIFLLLWTFHSIFIKEGKQWAEGANVHWEQLSRADQWRLAWTHGPEDLGHTLRLIHPGALLISTLLVGVTIFIGVVRWRFVLETQGLSLPLGRATRISLVAQFFNSFLLGSTGGDLIKAYYAARETHHQKTEAVTTVFVDRLVGLWTMLFFAAAMMLPNLAMLKKNPQLAATALVILAMFGSLTVILSLAFWGGVSKRFPRARHYLHQLPKGDLLERSLDSCRKFGQHKGFLAKSVALSVGVNLVSVIQIAVLGAGFDLGIPFEALLMIVPIILCISSLPITVGGLGVREKLYVAMLGVIAVPGPEALSVSLLASAQGIVWSLIGGIVYFGARQKEHLADVTQGATEEGS